MASLLSGNTDVTTSTESSPRKQLRHVGHGNTDALLGWIGFHAGSRVPVVELSQLDDGTVLLRLVDALTGFTESDRLRPTCVSADGPIPASVYVGAETPAASPTASSHSSTPSSPEKRQRKVKVVGGADGREMSRFQKLANIEVFMQWLNTSTLSPFHGVSKTTTTDEINIRGVAALDILDADKKLVPGLLWSLFWEFVLCPSRVSKNKQELLWLWVLNTIASFEGKPSKQLEPSINFKPETWSDTGGGLTRRLAAALHIIKPTANASVSEIFDIMYKTHKIPAFLKAEDLAAGVIDEWSLIAYFSCWFDVFNHSELEESDAAEDVEGESTIRETTPTPKSKGEFSEFFGPNILNKASAIAQHDYDMPLKLRIETFLVVSTKIISVKNNFLARLEKLLLEIVNLLGQFAEYESYDYAHTVHTPTAGSSRFSSNYRPDDLRFKGTDLHELERQILKHTSSEENDHELSETLQQAINSISFVSNFRNSTRQKVYEQFIELQMYQCQLADMLRVYGLQHFREPPEKSLDKISKFIVLLKRSETAVYSNANDFIEKNIGKVEKSFFENHKSLSSALTLVENDIITANAISGFEERTKELENIKNDIPGLKEFHLRTVSLLHELEMINSSLARGFDKQNYKSIINEQRYKLTFLEECIDKSIKFMTSLQTQRDEASEVLKIAKIAQQYEDSRELHDLSEDKKQLKTHLLVHKLIQRRFQFKKNIDPIQVLFDRHDTGSKGYLTKTEFKKAFLMAYPDTATLVGVDEVDTIFETSYETVGKMRRGIEFPQFKAVIELGNSRAPEGANMDDFAAALLDDASTEANDTVSINTTSSNIDRLLHQIETERLPVDLTNNLFYNSFAEISHNKDALEPQDLDRIHLHPMLRDNLENVFPEYNYRDWFQHVDQSSIYQDNEDAEGAEGAFAGHPREIGLKNVLYDLEKVDLSKI